MKERLWIPDYLKGWAVLIMIQAHIYETWIRQDVFQSSLGLLFRWFNTIPAAPVFMLLMGFLAYYTQADSKRLIWRGGKVFVWGLLLNAGLNFHYLIRLFSGLTEGDPLPSLLGVDIFFLAGISLIIIGFIRFSSSAMLISAVLSPIVALVAPVIHDCLYQLDPNSYVLAFFGNKASWSYFPLFPWLAYPLAGFAFAGLAKKLVSLWQKGLVRVVVLIILIPLASLGFVYNWNNIFHLEPYYHHGFAVYVWSVAFTLLVVILLQRFPILRTGAFSAWVQFAGKFLTRFYVIQWLIIGNLATFFYQQLGPGCYILGFILVSGITTSIVYLVRKKFSTRRK